MNDILKSALLGIVEGITEFLPISSTGHMLLVEPLLGIDAEAPPWKAFLYFIQIGAILAVIVHFRKPLTAELGARPAAGWTNHLGVKLAVAFLPAAIVGKLFHDVLEAHLEKPLPIAVALILGAVAMEWIERGHRGGTTHDTHAITLRQAFLIGIAQCVSMVPGTSRSMVTIMGGLLVGLSPAAAATFSFYLAIPTLIAAGGYSLNKHRDTLNADHATMLAVGFVTAFIVALVVVESFMQFVRERRLRPFAVYRVVLGGVVIAALAMGRIR